MMASVLLERACATNTITHQVRLSGGSNESVARACRRTMAEIRGGATVAPRTLFSPPTATQVVAIDRFCLDRTEVTVERYARCVALGECASARMLGADEEAAGASVDVLRLCNAAEGRLRHPINCVTADDAAAFCAFEGGRLPTDIEWACAAGGCGSAHFPWRDGELSAERANLYDLDAVDRFGNDLFTVTDFQWRDGWYGTSPVGSFLRGRSRDGVDDLEGNVAEFVAPTDTSGCTWARIGSDWGSSMRAQTGGPSFHLACIARVDAWDTSFGFRCASDLHDRRDGQ